MYEKDLTSMNVQRTLHTMTSSNIPDLGEDHSFAWFLTTMSAVLSFPKQLLLRIQQCQEAAVPPFPPFHKTDQPIGCKMVR